jgi:hypothetical protein
MGACRHTIKSSQGLGRQLRYTMKMPTTRPVELLTHLCFRLFANRTSICSHRKRLSSLSTGRTCWTLLKSLRAGPWRTGPRTFSARPGLNRRTNVTKGLRHVLCRVRRTRSVEAGQRRRLRMALFRREECGDARASTVMEQWWEKFPELHFGPQRSIMRTM